jgi:hypothetical protein
VRAFERNTMFAKIGIKRIRGQRRRRNIFFAVTEDSKHLTLIHAVGVHAQLVRARMTGKRAIFEIRWTSMTAMHEYHG